MTLRWERLVDKDSRYTIEDCERAAYRLITSQVLSVSDAQTKKDYFLVSENLREFLAALEPFGISLRHNIQFKYLVAQPRHVLNQNKASKPATLLVLVLADIYHRVRFNGQEGDFGEAYVDLPELQEAYQGLTGEDFPKSGELKVLLADLDRWGVARQWKKDMDESQPFRIMVHPAIADIVTKEWLTQLDAFNKIEEGSMEEAEDQGNEHVSA